MKLKESQTQLKIKKDMSNEYLISRPIERKTPEKVNLNNSRLSQSRKSRIFNHSDSKFISPPKQNLTISNKK